MNIGILQWEALERAYDAAKQGIVTWSQYYEFKYDLLEIEW